MKKSTNANANTVQKGEEKYPAMTRVQREGFQQQEDNKHRRNKS